VFERGLCCGVVEERFIDPAARRANASIFLPSSGNLEKYKELKT
jgi:hypothetical protein